MPTAFYFLRNRLLGQSGFPCDFTPHSLAYFCPTCGEVWGRIAVTGESPSFWAVEYVPCENHKPRGVSDWSAIPGTFCNAPLSTRNMLSKLWWGRALEHLPPPVLEREFNLTIEGVLPCASQTSEIPSSSSMES